MSLKYLLDENVDLVFLAELLRQNSSLVIRVVGGAEAPPKGTLDPEILCWCEENGFILVTNNRRSMPNHLVEHLNQNRHIPGIFILNSKWSLGQNIEELLLVADASFENEYQDQIVHLPLS